MTAVNGRHAHNPVVQWLSMSFNQRSEDLVLRGYLIGITVHLPSQVISDERWYEFVGFCPVSQLAIVVGAPRENFSFVGESESMSIAAHHLIGKGRRKCSVSYFILHRSLILPQATNATFTEHLCGDYNVMK